jgi:hypothetical protein
VARSARIGKGYYAVVDIVMDYPAFRAQALPIGSGTTESAVKQYTQRLCGPGMRWSRRGLERMVAIGSAVLNRTFHAHWHAT